MRTRTHTQQVPRNTIRMRECVYICMYYMLRIIMREIKRSRACWFQTCLPVHACSRVELINLSKSKNTYTILYTILYEHRTQAQTHGPTPLSIRAGAQQYGGGPNEPVAIFEKAHLTFSPISVLRARHA